MVSETVEGVLEKNKAGRGNRKLGRVTGKGDIEVKNLKEVREYMGMEEHSRQKK